MNKLVDQIEKLNADEAIQFEIEERERQFTERNALIEGYKEQALKQGLKKGIEQGKVDAKYEIARNMISGGIDIELISKMTGLAIDEIQKLQFNECEEPQAVAFSFMYKSVIIIGYIIFY